MVGGACKQCKIALSVFRIQCIRIPYSRYTKKKSKKFKKKFELEASNALRELRDALAIHLHSIN